MQNNEKVTPLNNTPYDALRRNMEGLLSLQPSVKKLSSEDKGVLIDAILADLLFRKGIGNSNFKNLLPAEQRKALASTSFENLIGSNEEVIQTHLDKFSRN